MTTTLRIDAPTAAFVLCLTVGLIVPPAAFAQESKNAMSKDAMSKGTMAKDTMSKDTMSKDSMGRSTMSKDSHDKDSMKQEDAPKQAPYSLFIHHVREPMRVWSHETLASQAREPHVGGGSRTRILSHIAVPSPYA
jgi:pentapeptide MXKDX repeat protein